MLALKMLIYALVNSAFSGFASLKLHLFIHSLRLWELAKLLFSQPLIFTFHPKPLPLRKEGLALTVAARKKWPHATSYHLKWGVMERNISKLIPGMGRESTERYSSLKRLFTAPLIDISAHLNVNPFSRVMFDMK